MEFMEQITIYHYSMVRDPVVLNHKIVDMHKWYYPTGTGDVDTVQSWIRDGRPFDYRHWKTDAELQPIPYPHPIAAEPWVKRHTNT